MAKQNDSPFPRELPRWLEPVVHSLARGRRSEALARIDQIIEEDYPLFWGDPSVDELLSQLSKAAERRVLVVAATNRREAIDEAVLRPGRFDVQIEIGPPDLEARASFLRAELKRRPAVPRIDVMPFVHATDGVTFAELKRIVDVAALKALKARRPITADDLSDSWRSQARS